MKITLFTGKTYTIEAELGFPIKIVKSALAKRLTLRIDEKSRIPVLTLPKYCSSRKAVQFVESHRDWITNMLARIPQSHPFASGEKISVFGKFYSICHQPERRGGAFLEENQLIVCGKPEFVHRRITDFLKKLAAEKLMELSQQKAAKINCQVNNVCIKDTKSRWGSCSNRNNINYNWRVILAPEYVINYLVCHEVAHLAHQDHSAAFWNCVAELCPDYQEGRVWLKIKGKSLYQYA